MVRLIFSAGPRVAVTTNIVFTVFMVFATMWWVVLVVFMYYLVGALLLWFLLARFCSTILVVGVTRRGLAAVKQTLANEAMRDDGNQG